MAAASDGGQAGGEGGPGERERLRATSRYSLYVGLAFLAIVVVATLNTIRSGDGGVLGTDEAQLGSPLPEFALPELFRGPEGDANIYADDCATAENPCPEDEQRVPACQVEGADVIRVCDLLDRPLVVSFWFSTPADCPPTQDVVEAAYRRYGQRVNFLSIAVRGERAELESIVRDRGWTLPVGWDRDGAASNLLRVGVCPTLALVRPGGVLEEVLIGSDELGEGRLEGAIESLLAESRRLMREIG